MPLRTLKKRVEFAKHFMATCIQTALLREANYS